MWLRLRIGRKKKYHSMQKNKIYVAATMRYGLGLDDEEEVAFYNKIKKKMKADKKKGHMGIIGED